MKRLLTSVFLLFALSSVSLAQEIVGLPTDITATPQDDGILLGWTPHPAADGVHVYSNQTNPEFAFIETVVAGEPQMLLISGLPTGEEVCFLLLSWEFQSEEPTYSEFSAPYCAVPGDAAPTEQCIAIVSSLPLAENVMAIAALNELNETIVTVDWDGVEGATGYNVYVNDEYRHSIASDTEMTIPHTIGDTYGVAAFNDQLSPPVYGGTTNGVPATEILIPPDDTVTPVTVQPAPAPALPTNGG